jgi:hypothetical protein
MDQWSYRMSAQIVDRMQREGVEVVESVFVQERGPNRLGRLIAALRLQLRPGGWPWRSRRPVPRFGLAGLHADTSDVVFHREDTAMAATRRKESA